MLVNGLTFDDYHHKDGRLIWLTNCRSVTCLVRIYYDVALGEKCTWHYLPVFDRVGRVRLLDGLYVRGYLINKLRDNRVTPQLNFLMNDYSVIIY